MIKDTIEESSFKDLSLYCLIDDNKIEINDLDEINKLNKKLRTKYKFKNTSSFLGYINSSILNEEEKLFLRIVKDFNKKTLIGDILIDDKEYNEIIIPFLENEINLLISSKGSHIPKEKEVFLTSLVEYGKRTYNKKGNGGFWTHFKKDYGISLTAILQGKINDLFEEYTRKYNKYYLTKEILDNKKIDNITNILIHSFATNYSLYQLFEFLFYFWKIDLNMNIDNLDETSDEDVTLFKELINEINSDDQTIIKHTTYLLNEKAPKEVKIIAKNRIRRILKLIDKYYWEDITPKNNENRINQYFNKWLNENDCLLENAKSYKKRSGWTKKELLNRTPFLSYKEDKLFISFPLEKFKELSNTEIKWQIINETKNNYEYYDVSSSLKSQNKSQFFFLENSRYELSFSFILDDLKINLLSGDEIIKSFNIKSEDYRFFDDDGDYINSNNIIPNGDLTLVSKFKEYPIILDKNENTFIKDNLFIKNYFGLEKGEIVQLDENKFNLIGEKIKGGLIGSIPLKNGYIKEEDNNLEIYNKLPKLCFKFNENTKEDNKIIINKKPFKIDENNSKLFKIEDEFDTYYYLVDLSKIIINNGIYEIFKVDKKGIKSLYFKFVYIKDFYFNFVKSPYIFNNNAELEIKNYKIKEYDEKQDKKWEIVNNTIKYRFNIIKEDEKDENYSTLLNHNILNLTILDNDNSYNLTLIVPALFYRFDENEKWMIKRHSPIKYSDLNKKYNKVYIDYNESDNLVIKANDELEIASEGNEIEFNKANKSFDITRIKTWLKNNREDKEIQDFNLIVNNNEYNFLNIICKSRLNSVSFLCDQKDKEIKIEANISGNEEYYITVINEDKTLCKNKKLIDNKIDIPVEEFSLKEYKIDIFELSKEDNIFGMDETLYIKLNKEPIIRKLIDLNNLSKGTIIKLKGIQDKNGIYEMRSFNYEYEIKLITKELTYETLLAYLGLKAYDDPIYGIWNENVNKNSLNYYEATISVKKKNRDVNFLHFDERFYLTFLNPNDINSLVILGKTERKDLGHFGYDNFRKCLICPKNHEDNKRNKEWISRIDMIYDDTYSYIIDIEQRKE